MVQTTEILHYYDMSTDNADIEVKNVALFTCFKKLFKRFSVLLIHINFIIQVRSHRLAVHLKLSHVINFNSSYNYVFII